MDSRNLQITFLAADAAAFQDNLDITVTEDELSDDGKSYSVFIDQAGAFDQTDVPKGCGPFIGHVCVGETMPYRFAYDPDLGFYAVQVDFDGYVVARMRLTDNDDFQVDPEEIDNIDGYAEAHFAACGILGVSSELNME